MDVSNNKLYLLAVTQTILVICEFYIYEKGISTFEKKFSERVLGIKSIERAKGRIHVPAIRRAPSNMASYQFVFVCFSTEPSCARAGRRAPRPDPTDRYLEFVKAVYGCHCN